jgi:hypothetical protein
MNNQANKPNITEVIKMADKVSEGVDQLIDFLGQLTPKWESKEGVVLLLGVVEALAEHFPKDKDEIVAIMDWYRARIICPANDVFSMSLNSN